VPSWRQKVYINYLEFFHIDFSPFIYLPNHLFISIWSPGYFILWVITQCYLINFVL
jgi:hypothetical protein